MDLGWQWRGIRVYERLVFAFAKRIIGLLILSGAIFDLDFYKEAQKGWYGGQFPSSTINTGLKRCIKEVEFHNADAFLLSD